MKRTIEAEYLMSLFFRTFYKLFCQISGVSLLTGTSCQYDDFHFVSL